MIEIQNTAVMNIEGAIRGARNPMNSWARSDSYTDAEGVFRLGDADLDLACRLIHSGTDHRKFIRQIFVSVDVSAPLYWWKEADQYKVGTVTDSCSTMHKIHAKPFSRADFSCDRMTPTALACLDHIIAVLEERRQVFVAEKERAAWDDMIQLLPSSYMQMRTCTLNYENLLNIYFARRTHKLPEWHVFCDWILTLPYMDAFTQAAARE